MTETDADSTRDVDPSDGRDETLNERMDRNWNEMLQETRITQTGTQLLSGFLLTIAFQPKFASLDGFDQGLYLCLVAAATLTTALALAPVYLHRGLFRRRAKPELVSVSHLLLRAALVGLAVVMVGTILFVFSVTAGRTAGMVAAGALVVVLAFFALLPRIVRTPRVQRRIRDRIN